MSKASSSCNEDDQEKSANENFLTRQFTLDTASRSSSSSSLENLAATEGASLIAINENSCTNNDPTSRLSQIWIGTNYGSVYVLNAISSCSSETPGNIDKEQMSTDKTASISPTGVQIKLKGRIVDINFLDLNGILLAPYNSNNNQYISHKTSAMTAELEDLDIDLDYSLSICSNSIADNFFGGTGGSVSSSNSQAQDTASGSSSSPNTTPTTSTTFVNPFNSQPYQDEPKDSKNKGKSKCIIDQRLRENQTKGLSG